MTGARRGRLWQGLRGESNPRPGSHNPLYCHYTTEATRQPREAMVKTIRSAGRRGGSAPAPPPGAWRQHGAGACASADGGSSPRCRAAPGGARSACAPAIPAGRSGRRGGGGGGKWGASRPGPAAPAVPLRLLSPPGRRYPCPARAGGSAWRWQRPSSITAHRRSCRSSSRTAPIRTAVAAPPLARLRSARHFCPGCARAPPAAAAAAAAATAAGHRGARR